MIDPGPPPPLRFRLTIIKISILYGLQVRNRCNSNRSGERLISRISISPTGGRKICARTRLNSLAAIGMLAAGVAAAQERVVIDLPLPPPGGAQAATVAMRSEAPATAAGSDSSANKKAPDTEVRAPVLVTSLAPGESLYDLFSRHGLSQADLVEMVSGNRRIKSRLRRLRPDHRIAIHASGDGRVARLYLEVPGPSDLMLERRNGRFTLLEIEDSSDVFLVPTPSATADESPGTTASIPDSPTPGTVRLQDSPESPAPPPGTPPLATEGAPPAGAGQQLRATDADTPVAARDPVEPEPQAPDTETVHQVVVKRGDSLYLIFRRLGIAPQDLAQLLEAGRPARSLRNLRPGQELVLRASQHGDLQGLAVALNETQTLRAERGEKGFDVRIDQEELERRAATASAVIEDSLFLAGQREGLSDRLIMELVEIFGWDVDFALDVRAGDRFSVVFEELYKNGEKLRDGHILASEFVNRGRSVRAVRYVDDTGRASYFSPEGLSMRKAFLRTPVNFSRISSRFTTGRMHPVLQRMRAHKGVDYAAPTGTPVRASGDGRVAFAGWKGGYGRTVILQHGSAYTTLYGHLSGIRKGVGNGSRVRQGDVIGYVGQTGLATGPHLHYEFRVRDVHQDPLRVKLPKALPIEARFRNDFLRKSAPLVAQLETLARTAVASSD